MGKGGGVEVEVADEDDEDDVAVEETAWAGAASVVAAG